VTATGKGIAKKVEQKGERGMRRRDNDIEGR